MSRPNHDLGRLGRWYRSVPGDVATLKYDVEGEPIASAQTLDARPADRADITFDLTGVDLGLSYRFELVVTDSAGETQTLDGPLDWTAPTVTIDAVTPQPATSQPAALTIRFSAPVFGFDLGDLSILKDNAPVEWVGGSLTSTDAQTSQLTGLDALGNEPAAYRVELAVPGSVVTDLAGNALSTSATEAWAVTLPADTDGDGDIDDADLGTAFANDTGPMTPIADPTATQLLAAWSQLSQ
ncbi:MAG: hypothetical protein ACE37H_03470 [Phycisphaeraceae bacterium]